MCFVFAKVLSCDHQNLVPASNSHINALYAAIHLVTTKGGSDHR